MSPDRVSRYRVLSDIGHGGMGRVTLAEDTELNRRVALKFLAHSGIGDRSTSRRLMREAQAAARLDHPFICKVYEVGESGDDEPFIAMEYLEGETLKDRLARGPLPLAEALRLGAEMAEALDCAQTRGVVHRDLKPSNVMLTGDGHVKVMDFGIAKQTLAEASSTEAATTTGTGTDALTGTLAYMSPEQLRGQAVDSRSDVFSFGLVLYEMLTGRHPFASESPLATAEAILGGPAPPLARHMKGPPALLEHLLERLLARARDERVQTFRDVRAELRSISGTGAVPAAGEGTRRPWRRVAAWSAAVLGATLAAWAILAWLDRPALAFNERDWIVVADVDNETGDPVFDRSLSTALTVGLSQSQYVNVLPASRIRDARQRMQRPAADPLNEPLASEVAVREGAKAVVACSISKVGAVYHLTAQLVDPHTHASVLTESVRAASKDEVLPALDDLATRVRRNLGESLGALSQQHLSLPKATTASLDALKLYADAGRAPDSPTKFRLLEQAVALDPDFAMAHAQLGLDYYLQSERSLRLKGEQHVRTALGLLDRLSQRERLLVAALAEDSRGNRDAAVTAYKAYLTAYPDDSDVWFRLGWTSMATLRRYEAAAEAFRRVIAISPNNSAALVNLATALTGLRRDEEAREAYERAFAIKPGEMLGFFVNHEYGFTLVRLGDVDGATDVFGQMIAESGPEKRARGQRSMALLEMYLGHYRKAAERFGEAIVIEQANDYPVSEFRDRLFLAAALAGRGRSSAVDAELTRVEALIARLSLGPEWLRLAAKFFARHGRVDRAETLLAAMERTIGDPTSDSSANRNTRRDRAHLDVARGEVALSAGRADEAVGILEPTAQVDTDNADTLDSLASAYLAAGRDEDAARTYEAIIAAQPFGTEAQPYWFDAHLRLAEIRLRQGRADAARTMYESMLRIWKDADDDLQPLLEAKKGLEGIERR